MHRVPSLTLLSSLLITSFASHPASAFDNRAGAARESAPARYAAARRGAMGGGLFEALFSGAPAAPANGPIYAPRYEARTYPRYEVAPMQRHRPAAYGRGEPAAPIAYERPTVHPRYQRQVVGYDGKERPGTIVIDTPNRLLYLVQEGGTALRYGIGVGRPGFTWAGAKTVSMKREWPDWRPPDEMLKRRPDLPRFMPGGPDNPLGARALYLGSSLYRIHGSNEPWTIGTAVSSGCIRMRNEDVIDLYGRVNVGARVVVI